MNDNLRSSQERQYYEILQTTTPTIQLSQTSISSNSAVQLNTFSEITVPVPPNNDGTFLVPKNSRFL